MAKKKAPPPIATSTLKNGLSMSSLTTVQARNQFSEVINRAAFGKERVVLTRRSHELVAVVPIEDMRLLQSLENQIDIEAARTALKEPGSIPWKTLKAELGL